MNKVKQQRTVVHLELEGGRHYYFGNLKALCDNFDKETIGVGHAYLKNYGITEDNPFRNKYCIIRKGILLTSPKKMEYPHIQYPLQTTETDRVVRAKGLY